jgi:CRISPR-associated protein Csd1
VILQALYRLACREGLAEDPDYEKKRVDFVLRVGEDGRLLALVPTRDEKGRGIERWVPQLPTRAVNIAPRFMVDNAKYVLGLDDAESGKPERTAQCATAFRESVTACAEATRDPGAVAVRQFLEDTAAQLPALLAQRPREEWTGGEVLAFELDGPEGGMVHERPRVRAFWAEFRARAPTAEARPLRCLVTGDIAVPERLHPTIKGLASLGGQSSGAMLVSFNDPAFCAQGLEQGDNAPVSRKAAAGYGAALNFLLQRLPSGRLRSGVRIGDEAIALFWTREAHPDIELLASLFEPTAEDAVRVAEAPLRGLEPAPLDDTAFYALTVSANAARVVVRDWLETSVAEVKRNVARYFEDLRVGHRPPVPVGIRTLSDCLAGPGGTSAPPDLTSRLFAAALRGHPLPRQLLPLALRRLRLPPDPKTERRFLPARVALVKATLLRLPRSGLPPMEVSVSLNEDNRDVAYLLGRLFAVLERLQGAALGDVNASLRDRYFAGASSTPAAVFPRLLRLSIHHAAKADSGGWLEKVKGSIIGALPDSTLPALLSLEQQGLFAVGYYHQRERFFERKE